MKSRPLKVGEYRKVKTWEQLLATDGFEMDSEGDIEAPNSYFTEHMSNFCGVIIEIGTLSECGSTLNSGFIFHPDFFTNDYYDENGNEIETPREYHWVDDTNPLDQLEQEANLTLTKISKLREIEAKQAEMDKLGLEIEEMITDYKKGEL